VASSSYVKTFFGSVPAELKGPLGAAFSYVLANLRLGRPMSGSTLQDRGANLQVYPLTATTPSTPGEEFSIMHGLPTVPYLLIPAIDPQTIGSQLVPLTVTRAADSVRVYLSSTVADAPVVLYAEA